MVSDLIVQNSTAVNACGAEVHAASAEFNYHPPPSSGSQDIPGIQISSSRVVRRLIRSRSLEQKDHDNELVAGGTVVGSVKELKDWSNQQGLARQLLLGGGLQSRQSNSHLHDSSSDAATGLILLGSKDGDTVHEASIYSYVPDVDSVGGASRAAEPNDEEGMSAEATDPDSGREPDSGRDEEDEDWFPERIAWHDVEALLILDPVSAKKVLGGDMCTRW